MRPEYTAGICRAFVSNGELTQQLPLKLFAAGPMFRYERPQKGRQRQFHQIDLEVLGAPEPGADIEVISVAADILDRLGILDRCVLKLNSLGDPESRAAYRKVLVDYYSATSASFPRIRAIACSAIPCASSTARTRATRRSTPARRRSPTI